MRHFAHESEARFARILDFYGVLWDYEPVEFVLAWDSDGRPTSAFRPDFWLPHPGLFVELTTLNQRLVTKKNGKVRRMGLLYPDVRVTILYQRDTLALLAKYGLADASVPRSRTA
jgi:bifunctional protein TilS/HprT